MPSVADEESEKAPKAGTPLRNLTIGLWASGLILLAAGAVWTLLHFFGAGTDADKQRLDVIRTAGTIVVGTGGIAALYLAARRQQSAERTLEHTRYVEASKERDATERRISEQYARAAEHLGSDKAPVRLAALYALERLANANVDQRQVVVSLMCAYLRMPYELPKELGPLIKAGEREEHADARQEREVRLAAQSVLARHLRPGESDVAPWWGKMSLDLSGAHLINFDLSDCHVVELNCSSAKFSGDNYFERSKLGSASFSFTTFDGGVVSFYQATIENYCDFEDCRFNSLETAADFNQATFGYVPDFSGSKFGTRPVFSNATVVGYIGKRGVAFEDPPGWELKEVNGGRWGYVPESAEVAAASSGDGPEGET